MKKILITTLFLFYSIIAFCQHGFKQKLGNIASITFPDTPKTESDKTSVFYKLSSGGIFYLCQTFPQSQNLQMFTRHANDSLYANFIKASVIKFKGTLFYKKNITFNGIKGVEYGYKATVDSVNYYRYRQVFCLNDVFIMNGISSADSLQANSGETRAFFKTFKLTIGKGDIRQENMADVIFTGSFALYLIITIVLLTLFFTLVIYIIRKIAYK